MDNSAARPRATAAPAVRGDWEQLYHKGGLWQRWLTRWRVLLQDLQPQSTAWILSYGSLCVLWQAMFCARTDSSGPWLWALSWHLPTPCLALESCWSRWCPAWAGPVTLVVCVACVFAGKNVELLKVFDINTMKQAPAAEVSMEGGYCQLYTS